MNRLFPEWKLRQFLAKKREATYETINAIATEDPTQWQLTVIGIGIGIEIVVEIENGIGGRLRIEIRILEI